MALKLSLVIPVSADDESILRQLLASIRRQSFPKTDMEILIQREGNSEEAKAYGIQKAQGEIIGLLCADNEFTETSFLSDLVCAAADPHVIGAYPARYAWMPTDRLLNRYFALLGANDPLCWWLGKADRHSYSDGWYGISGRSVDILNFASQIPSLGDNGFFVKASAIKPFVTDPRRHFCVDVCEDMRRAGLAAYTITNHTIWHKTGVSFWTWLKKRSRYVNELYWQAYEKRRWKMVSSTKDWFLAVAFVLASLLLLPHLWVVIRGYRRVRDKAWFLHPLICLCLTCVYTWAMMQYVISRVLRRWKHLVTWHGFGPCEECHQHGWNVNH